ncbi:putative Caspase-like domain-containing protein [Rosa chinensis]|uniref:Putative Caspase-like domain-containing protein n=1 Tax=Rosa chinensis TaxID=74649 RepID=A0A2P6SEL8_ROSCH|nr:metacaspase-1 [Rosa chinensis]XP_040370563.1 metacaspase-1 [Rosa chinensis]PRQ57121.1 putative Caspase-like domain-containing protein [Rosa chinensis]
MMMSNYGGQQLLVIDCCYCQTQIPLVSPISVLCRRCGRCTRVASPGFPRSPYSAVPYYVRINRPPHAGFPHRLPGPPPKVHRRKKAVICGISYLHTRGELNGCINDAKLMRSLLISKFNFAEDSIIMLTEKETDPYKIPYKRNIEGALRWLVRGCQPGDSLLFYFSGHGSQLREQYRGDELDGKDETLCPLDFKTKGMIRDDWINATIVGPIPRDVKLHAIVDSCSSGTILDLPWLCNMDRDGSCKWDKASGVWKGASGGEVICISGCHDNQTSAETQSIPTTGVMTFCFIQAIKSGQAATYGSLLNSMRSAIRSMGSAAGGSGGAVTSLAGMLLAGGRVGGGGLRQEPQLTAGTRFDVYTKPFTL